MTLVHRGRPFVEVLREDGLARGTLEWRHAAEQLVDDDGEGIDVRLLGHRRSRDLLGCEVLRRRVHDETALRRRRVSQARQLHVHQLDGSVRKNHDVLGAERAVNEAEIVKRLDGGAEVERPALRIAAVERLGRRQDLAQALALDELHDHEGPSRLGLTQLQHADEPWMRHEASDARLTHIVDASRDAGRRRHPAGQEPDCDSLRGYLVLGEPHGPEGARPDLTDDPVTALDAPSDESALARPASLRPTHAHCARGCLFPRLASSEGVSEVGLGSNIVQRRSRFMPGARPRQKGKALGRALSELPASARRDGSAHGTAVADYRAACRVDVESFCPLSAGMCGPGRTHLRSAPTLSSPSD